MNHRVKNLLTLCNGIVSLSKRSARSVDEMANAVEGRLRALASAHDLTLPALSQPDEEADRTTTLRNILTTIVAPHIASSAAKARVISDGPDVPVSGKAAANLALLLHELTTNAAKYGALSSDSGHIEVRWKLRSSRLLLTWKERGGPVLDGPPAKGGFGTLLARQIVTAPLGGDIAYDWQRDGLGVAIAISADRLTPVLTPPRRAKSPRT
jgi:two-component sensor histidine kinase